MPMESPFVNQIRFIFCNENDTYQHRYMQVSHTCIADDTSWLQSLSRHTPTTLLIQWLICIKRAWKLDDAAVKRKRGEGGGSTAGVGGGSSAGKLRFGFIVCSNNVGTCKKRKTLIPSICCNFNIQIVGCKFIP